MGAAASVQEALDFLGSEASAIVVIRNKITYGNYVAVDIEKTGRKNEKGVYDRDVTLLFGKVRGMCAANGHNALEYTVQVEDNHSEVVRRRFLQHILLPELLERGIAVGAGSREVAVELEWQCGQRFVAELLKRQKGLFEVRFVGGGRELLSGVPAEQLHPVDSSAWRDRSPDTTGPDPLWKLDRKIQADIDVRWPIRRRIREALELLRSQMRPPAAPPLRGPFVGAKAQDSEGFPAHPAPMPELRVDGAFVDTWGKYAGKIKFATTYKIGPRYPRMDAWVDRVDAGDPLYFQATLPVYAGLICLGMYKNPGDPGPGKPEWVRAEDVALVGIALYINGELFTGEFTDPPLEANGFQNYGHEACHFIPGCASTYMADATWVGATFCLAPEQNDMEVRDDIYNIAAYHQVLRDWATRSHDANGAVREISVQINLVISTSYLANLRQVCSGAVRVQLSDQGLAIAYDRMRDIEERRLNSEEALNPRRPRKALSELTWEDGLQMRLGDVVRNSQLRNTDEYLALLQEEEEEEDSERMRRTQLEDRFGVPLRAIPRPPPARLGADGAAPPETPVGVQGPSRAPIRGPNAMYEIGALPPPPKKRGDIMVFRGGVAHREPPHPRVPPPGSRGGVAGLPQGTIPPPPPSAAGRPPVRPLPVPGAGVGLLDEGTKPQWPTLPQGAGRAPPVPG